MTEEKLEMIKKVNILYEENLQKNTQMMKQLKDIELKEKRAISYKKKSKYERELKKLKEDYNSQYYKTLGIDLARKELLYND